MSWKMDFSAIGRVWLEEEERHVGLLKKSDSERRVQEVDDLIKTSGEVDLRNPIGTEARTAKDC